MVQKKVIRKSKTKKMTSTLKFSKTIISKLYPVTTKLVLKRKKKKSFLLAKLCLFTVLLLSFVAGYCIGNDTINYLPRQVEEKENEVKVIDTSLSLVMVGDALIHSAVYGDASRNGNYDFTTMLENIKPIISKYDLAYYNQETVLGGKELGLSSYPRFNSPYEVGDAFRDAGFNLVSLANNHTLDRGEEAIKNSLNYWNTYKDNVLVNGSATSFDERNDFRIIEKNNIRYTMLSYTDSTNGIPVPDGKEYLVNVYSEDQIKMDIESLKDKTDVIIVAMHWGDEYSINISPRQRNIAKYLSDLGVNIIIGTHPHVIEPMEYIGDTLVVYSLGNFISAQRGVEKLTGLMASINIRKIDTDGNVKIILEKPAAELIYTYSEMNSGYRKNFKVYPYSMLTEYLLPNYTTYQEKYMNISRFGNL